MADTGKKFVPLDQLGTALGDTKQYIDKQVKDIEEGAFKLAPATAEALGGVKAGDGVSIGDDGTLSVSYATDDDVRKVVDGVFGVQEGGNSGDTGGESGNTGGESGDQPQAGQ